MATRSSVGSGLWSNAAVWDTGVPVDGDDVVITAGHTVTFDVNQSAFVTGVQVTVNGVLSHTIDTGVYCLFLKTGYSMTGSGMWEVGTKTIPIPFVSKHTIKGASGWHVTGSSGLKIRVYGYEPVYKYVRLTGAESAGSTVLEIDTDVTGDVWADGDTVTITNATQTVSCEVRTIAAGGIAAGAITITSGLSTVKSVGSYVCILSRHIFFDQSLAAVFTFQNFNTGSDRIHIGGGYFLGNNSYGFYNITSCIIEGGCFASYSFAFSQIYNSVFQGEFVITNTSRALSSGTVYINGGIFAGQNYSAIQCTCVIIDTLVVGAQYGIWVGSYSYIYDFTVIGGYIGLINCADTIISSGIIMNTTTAFAGMSRCIISGVTLIGNGTDVSNPVDSQFVGIEFTSLAELNAVPVTDAILYTEAINYDNVLGAYKAWTAGGVVLKQSSVIPTGYSFAYAHTLNNATYYCFWKKAITVPSGVSITISFKLRKTVSMITLPKVYLMDFVSNPLVGAAPLQTFEMTNTIDTWESGEFAITNNADFDKEYMLWFVGRNATGTMYSAVQIEYGGGGAVRIVG